MMNGILLLMGFLSNLIKEMKRQNEEVKSCHTESHIVKKKVCKVEVFSSMHEDFFKNFLALYKVDSGKCSNPVFTHINWVSNEFILQKNYLKYR